MKKEKRILMDEDWEYLHIEEAISGNIHIARFEEEDGTLSTFGIINVTTKEILVDFNMISIEKLITPNGFVFFHLKDSYFSWIASNDFSFVSQTKDIYETREVFKSVPDQYDKMRIEEHEYGPSGFSEEYYLVGIKDGNCYYGLISTEAQKELMVDYNPVKIPVKYEKIQIRQDFYAAWGCGLWDIYTEYGSILTRKWDPPVTSITGGSIPCPIINGRKKVFLPLVIRGIENCDDYTPVMESDLYGTGETFYYILEKDGYLGLWSVSHKDELGRKGCFLLRYDYLEIEPLYESFPDWSGKGNVTCFLVKGKDNKQGVFDTRNKVFVLNTVYDKIHFYCRRVGETNSAPAFYIAAINNDYCALSENGEVVFPLGKKSFFELRIEIEEHLRKMNQWHR